MVQKSGSSPPFGCIKTLWRMGKTTDQLVSRISSINLSLLHRSGKFRWRHEARQESHDNLPKKESLILGLWLQGLPKIQHYWRQIHTSKKVNSIPGTWTYTAKEKSWIIHQQFLGVLPPVLVKAATLHARLCHILVIQAGIYQFSTVSQPSPRRNIQLEIVPWKKPVEGICTLLDLSTNASFPRVRWSILGTDFGILYLNNGRYLICTW